MSVKPFICLMLFSVTGAMGSSSTGFLLGVNYSEWLNFPANNGAEIAADSSGSLYILSGSHRRSVTRAAQRAAAPAVGEGIRISPDGCERAADQPSCSRELARAAPHSRFCRSHGYCMVLPFRRLGHRRPPGRDFQRGGRLWGFLPYRY
jgi:hypothetical protein